jgi:hypothetical protein
MEASPKFPIYFLKIYSRLPRPSVNVPVTLGPNASAQPLPEAGATQERTLEAVGCSALILIEAPSPADHRGMLIMGKTC